MRSSILLHAERHLRCLPKSSELGGDGKCHGRCGVMYGTCRTRAWRRSWWGTGLYAAMSRADLGVTMHKSGGELPGFCGVDFALIIPCLLQDGQMAEPYCGIFVARSHLNTHRAASGAWSSCRWIPGRSLHVNFPASACHFLAHSKKTEGGGAFSMQTLRRSR